ncbi:MAG: L,D-transpeptidase family protein [Woeseiaceae bacterium]|nr:L,D-transpeptidase family protein [Woeseiaceae bacterium]
MFRLGTLLLLLLMAPVFAGGDERRPAYLLEVPDSIGTVLIAETSTATLHYFGDGAAGAVRTGGSYMSIGLKGAGKQRAWDGKTPLGIYFITEQLDTSKLHEKYGPTAFPLDYPNIWDRHNRRSGDGIWIHGVAPNGGRRPERDTDGCIALPNDELLQLQPRLEPSATPVVITREIRWRSDDQVAAARAELRGGLDAWAASYAAGDLHGYLSLYADDFTYRGMDRDQWTAFRTQSITNAPPREIALDEVFLLADPEDEGLYLARFRQTIRYDDRTVATVKRLYWRRTPDGELRIVAEDNG